MTQTFGITAASRYTGLSANTLRAFTGLPEGDPLRLPCRRVGTDRHSVRVFDRTELVEWLERYDAEEARRSRKSKAAYEGVWFARRGPSMHSSSQSRPEG
jgi:hypothetical protein